jgi:TetR/AcrR family acrAB operon transcriptional repressor
MSAEKPKSDNREREQRILDAAARLIIQYGYDKTTMNDIAAAAGVSKGALYLHFASKDTLFDALFKRETLRYSEVWLQRLAADPQGATFATLYTQSLHALQTSPLLLALLRQDQRVLGAYARRQESQFAQQKRGNIVLLEQLMAIGAIRTAIPPHIVAHIMNMLAYGLVSMAEVMPSADIPPLEELITGIGTLLDLALTPPDGGNPEAMRAIVQQLVAAAQAQLRPNPTE